MVDELPPRLVKDILGFYIDHPKVAESTEGLARWRLLERYVEQTMRETEQAVVWLVAQGFLSEVKSAGNRRAFALNPERLGDAEALLRGRNGVVDAEEPNGRS